MSRQYHLLNTIETCINDLQVDYTLVSDLPDKDQFLVKLCHGWDGTNHGGLIVPYPNVPHLAVPLPHLQPDRVQVFINFFLEDALCLL